MALQDGKKVAREIQNKLQVKIVSLPVKPLLCIMMCQSLKDYFIKQKVESCIRNFYSSPGTYGLGVNLRSTGSATTIL